MAHKCDVVKKLLALLYYVVEIKGAREVEKALAMARRVGIDEVTFVVALMPHLRCQRWGRSVVCHPDHESRKAYWECRHELEKSKNLRR
jgi:hypothetical protein